MSWKSTCSFSIEKRASASDSSYFFDNAIVLGVVPGEYEAAAQIEDYEGSPFVARIRVQLSGRTVARREPLGAVVVDFGQIMICDRDKMERLFDRLGDDGMSAFYDQLNTLELTGVVSFGDDVTAPIFRPGFGDGRYPANKLVSGKNEIIGIEIVCATAEQQ